MQESFTFSDSDNQKAEGQKKIDEGQKLEKSTIQDNTFWFACDDFHHSRLIISAAETESSHEVIIHDASGSLVNKVKLRLNKQKLLVLDLDILAADCSVQSGICHGTVRVVSPANTIHELNVFCSDKKYRPTEDFNLSKTKAVFMPLMLGQDSNTSLLFAAADGPESSIKVRLYTGTRSPEIDFRLPAYGAKNLNIETEFADYLNLNSDKPTQAYLRIISNTANDVKVKLLEKSFNVRQLSSEELE